MESNSDSSDGATLSKLPEIQVPEQIYQQIVLDAEPLRNKEFTLNMPELEVVREEVTKFDAPTSIYGKVDLILTDRCLAESDTSLQTFGLELVSLKVYNLEYLR